VDKIGNKRALLFSILVWSIVLLWARFIGFCGSPLKEFYVLGILAGSVMGGSQSASRSLQGMFTPVHKGAEFFGFFGVCGKFSAMIGPFVYGTAVVLTGNIKSGIVALLAFFIFGGILLYFVDEQEGMKAAEEC
jgi:UMF1 family MFS transporter